MGSNAATAFAADNNATDNNSGDEGERGELRQGVAARGMSYVSHGIAAAADANPATPRSGAILDRIINAYAMFVSLSYLLLVSTALELLACTSRRDGRATLNAQPSLVCYADWWYDLLPVCIMAILIYGIGIPVGISVWLHRNATRVDEPRFAARFGSLFEQYGERYPFWEGAVMLEKAMFAAVGIMASGFVAFQIAILVALFVGTMVLYDRTRPYAIARDNEMQHRLRWCSLAVLCAGMIFVTNVFPGEWARRIVIVCACTAIVVGCIVIGVAVLFQVRDVYREGSVAVPKDLISRLDKVLNPRGLRAVLAFVRSDPSRADERVDALGRIISAINDIYTVDAKGNDDDVCHVVDTDKQARPAAKPEEISVARTFTGNVWLAESLLIVAQWLFADPEGIVQRECFFPFFADMAVWTTEHATTSSASRNTTILLRKIKELAARMNCTGSQSIAESTAGKEAGQRTDGSIASCDADNERQSDDCDGDDCDGDTESERDAVTAEALRKVYGHRLTDAAWGLPMLPQVWQDTVHNFFVRRQVWLQRLGGRGDRASPIVIGDGREQKGAVIGNAGDGSGDAAGGTERDVERLRALLLARDREIKKRDSEIKKRDREIEKCYSVIEKQNQDIAERDRQIETWKNGNVDRSK